MVPLELDPEDDSAELTQTIPSVKEKARKLIRIYFKKLDEAKFLFPEQLNRR